MVKGPPEKILQCVFRVCTCLCEYTRMATCVCNALCCECHSAWQVSHVETRWNLWWTRISGHLTDCPEMKLSLSLLSPYLFVPLHLNTHRHTVRTLSCLLDFRPGWYSFTSPVAQPTDWGIIKAYSSIAYSSLDLTLMRHTVKLADISPHYNRSVFWTNSTHTLCSYHKSV